MKQETEKKMEERVGNRLIEKIIAKTYSRHSKLSSEDYIKAIGFGGKTDDEGVAVRQAILNLLVATTKELFLIKTSAGIINASFELLVDKEEAENGTKQSE